MRRLATISIVVLAVALVWLWWPRDRAPTVGTTDPSASSAAADRGAAVPDDAETATRDVVALGAETERSESDAPGSILARLLFADDASPIPDVTIVLTDELEWTNRLEGPRARTDAAGIARFASVAPGWHVVAVDRVTWRAARVLPGTETTVDLAVTRHGTVVGCVVDAHGEPVEDAEIMAVANYAGLPSKANSIARSDAEGRFHAELWAVNTILFARKAGHGTSHDHELLSFGQESTFVELVLPSGARPVRGLVVDGAGRRVGDAEVFVKTSAPRPGPGVEPSGLVARWPRATTAPDGTFVVEDVPPGPFSGVARAPGFAPTFFDTVVQRADRDGEVMITLRRGATLRGRVVDERGDQVEDAVVQATIAAPWLEAVTRTDAEGEFVLDGINDGRATQPSGAVRVQARHETAGFATTTLKLEAGESATWNATLRAAGTITGRVVRADGTPLAGHPVRATPRDPDETQLAATDENGTFRLLVGTDAPFDVVVMDVRGFPPADLARADGVRPGCDPLELVVPEDAWPSAYLSGRFLRPAGYEDEPVRVQLADESARWGTVFGAAPDGSFRVGPLAPGSYRGVLIGFRSKLSDFEIGPFRLAPHQELDVGSVAIPAPVIVELEPRSPPDHEITVFRARLLRASDREEVATLRYQDGETYGEPGIDPGRYVLAVPAGYGWGASEVPCELRAGPPNVIAFDIVPLRRVRVRVVGPDGETVPDDLSVRVEPPAARGAERPVRDGRAFLSLAPGSHVVTAAHAGRKGRVEIRVDAPTGPVIDAELQLR